MTDLDSGVIKVAGATCVSSLLQGFNGQDMPYVRKKRT